MKFAVVNPNNYPEYKINFLDEDLNIYHRTACHG